MNQFAQAGCHEIPPTAAASAKDGAGSGKSFIYLTSTAERGQLKMSETCAKHPGTVAATIIIVMKPQTIGRVLGIGMRVAGRMAGQRLAGASQNGASRSPNRPVTVPGVGGPAQRRATGSLARGLGGFVRPFRRVGGIVFLEVMGVFFFLFVLVFAQTMWRMRASYAHGPDHQKFLVAAGLLVVFLYLTISSFWRAQHK
jgi:hypothetical protein